MPPAIRTRVNNHSTNSTSRKKGNLVGQENWFGKSNPGFSTPIKMLRNSTTDYSFSLSLKQNKILWTLVPFRRCTHRFNETLDNFPACLAIANLFKI